MRQYKGLDPWSVTIDDFPPSDNATAQLRAAICWAVLAPSGHNTQPWLFRVADDVAEVRADRTKALPVVDPDDREMMMSCAAAVTNVELAMARFGRPVEVEWFPDPSDADLVAAVRAAGDAAPPPSDTAMFDAITVRQTNRSPFRPEAVPVEALEVLSAIAAARGVSLTVAVDEQKGPIADLIAEGDRVQMSDKSFRRELAAWVHQNRTHHLDGIRGYAFNYGDLASHVGPHLIRSFDMGKSQAARDRQLATESPALLVIGTPGDTAMDWVNSGQALQRILLRMTADGMAASFLNQPIEVPTLREQLALLLNDGSVPQLLLRAGYPTARQPHTPRIKASERLL